jgi:hypothetical protein
MAVPEAACRAKSVEWLAALAETVEMLLSNDFELKPILALRFNHRPSKLQFDVAGAIAKLKRGRTFGPPEEECLATKCHLRT